MKLMSFGLLAGGWVIVVAATWLLHVPLVRTLFVIAGSAIQVMGLVLAVRAHKMSSSEKG
ncbi:MAG TPA: hypothetical protein VM715_00865 [Candidatus Acidoferrum sp.]|jgi:energy-converting hydrogenase Eha subunit C|nr:hypothetical protein [Candidatus Acidoferrum sp.]